VQLAPSPAACAAQDKDFFNGQCVDKCPAGQQHNPPNGACGPIPASAQTCAARNQDFFAGMCVPKCPANQVHQPPDGRCAAPPGAQGGGGGAGGNVAAPAQLQVTPTAQTCAAQNKDLFDGKCVDKCPGTQVHQQPDGKCAPNQGAQGAGGSTPRVVQTAATCAALKPAQDVFMGMCVEKCRGNQIHAPPEGMCVPRPPNARGQ
jgi:hypothetical protein